MNSMKNGRFTFVASRSNSGVIDPRFSNMVALEVEGFDPKKKMQTLTLRKPITKKGEMVMAGQTMAQEIERLNYISTQYNGSWGKIEVRRAQEIIASLQESLRHMIDTMPSLEKATVALQKNKIYEAEAHIESVKRKLYGVNCLDRPVAAA